MWLRFSTALERVREISQAHRDELENTSNSIWGFDVRIKELEGEKNEVTERALRAALQENLDGAIDIEQVLAERLEEINAEVKGIAEQRKTLEKEQLRYALVVNAADTFEQKLGDIYQKSVAILDPAKPEVDSNGKTRAARLTTEVHNPSIEASDAYNRALDRFQTPGYEALKEKTKMVFSGRRAQIAVGVGLTAACWAIIISQIPGMWEHVGSTLGSAMQAITGPMFVTSEQWQQNQQLMANYDVPLIKWYEFSQWTQQNWDAWRGGEIGRFVENLLPLLGHGALYGLGARFGFSSSPWDSEGTHNPNASYLRTFLPLLERLTAAPRRWLDELVRGGKRESVYQTQLPEPDGVAEILGQMRLRRLEDGQGAEADYATGHSSQLAKLLDQQMAAMIERNPGRFTDGR